jgi:hypothetical protein
LKNWQAALVLPQAGWVLETRPHRLVRDLMKMGAAGHELDLEGGRAPAPEIKRAGDVLTPPARAILQ